MNDSDIEVLTAAGWECECLSPLELRHAESGSFATGLAAQFVVDGVRQAVDDENAVPLESASEYQSRLFSKLKDLQELATRHVQTARTIAVPGDDRPWHAAFDLVFNDTVSGAVRECVRSLNINFEPYDPDGSYEDDVIAYVGDLESLVRRHAAFFPDEVAN